MLLNTTRKEATFVSVKFGTAAKPWFMTTATVTTPSGQQQSFAQQFMSLLPITLMESSELCVSRAIIFCIIIWSCEHGILKDVDACAPCDTSNVMMKTICTKRFNKWHLSNVVRFNIRQQIQQSLGIEFFWPYYINSTTWRDDYMQITILSSR